MYLTSSKQNLFNFRNCNIFSSLDKLEKIVCEDKEDPQQNIVGEALGCILTEYQLTQTQNFGCLLLFVLSASPLPVVVVTSTLHLGPTELLDLLDVMARLSCRQPDRDCQNDETNEHLGLHFVSDANLSSAGLGMIFGKERGCFYNNIGPIEAQLRKLPPTFGTLCTKHKQGIREFLIMGKVDCLEPEVLRSSMYRVSEAFRLQE